MGILKELTLEYFGEIERDEDKLLMPQTLPEGVKLHKFKDKNGRNHKNGFYIESKDIYIDKFNRLSYRIKRKLL